MAATIDYLCHAFTPDRAAVWDEAIAGQGIPLKVRRAPDDSFCPVEQFVARLDELGVATVVVPTGELHRHGTAFEYDPVAARPDELDRFAGAHPGRFAAWWTVNPQLGWEGVARARAAVEARPWVVGLWIHTHSFDRRFDHADYYPWYALAAELRLAVAVQAGSSGGLMASECGRPIGIDRPALYFPDVPFVLSHTGWPWVEEALAMALKFPNVWLGTAAYPPAHWPAELVAFLRGPGRRKVLFGTNFPTVGHRHALGQLDDLDLPEDTRRLLLGDNARRALSRLSSSLEVQP